MPILRPFKAKWSPLDAGKVDDVRNVAEGLRGSSGYCRTSDPAPPAPPAVVAGPQRPPGEPSRLQVEASAPNWSRSSSHLCPTRIQHSLCALNAIANAIWPRAVHRRCSACRGKPRRPPARVARSSKSRAADCFHIGDAVADEHERRRRGAGHSEMLSSGRRGSSRSPGTPRDERRDSTTAGIRPGRKPVDSARPFGVISMRPRCLPGRRIVPQSKPLT